VLEVFPLESVVVESMVVPDEVYTVLDDEWDEEVDPDPLVTEVVVLDPLGVETYLVLMVLIPSPVEVGTY
jgi:hypothetical protein